MKTRFIVNARSGAASKAMPLVDAFAARHHADVVLTQRPRHATELTAQAIADGCELVVAVGGDGTMNEVASAVIGAGVILGLVPCGSGDGLGRHLRIHGSVPRALEVLLSGAPRLIDTATADGHPFLTAAGIGFEAEIAHRFNRLQRRGFLRYLSTSARTAWGWKPQRYVITTESERFEVRAFTLAVANADQYGNDARIAPGARADDGLINLTAVPPVGLFSGPALLWRLFSGSLAQASGVRTVASEQFTVERETPGWLHTDGELHEAGTRIEFRVRPGSLRIMTPAEPEA